MTAWRVCAGICGCLAILAGCTHDFDAFESLGDEAGAGNDAGDACAVAPVCTNNAKSCADNCNKAEGQCEDNCGGGGGGGRAQCKTDCADAGVVCVASCVSACTLCTNCAATDVCKAAVK